MLFAMLVCLVMVGVAAGEEDSGHIEPKNVSALCSTTTATVSWSAVSDNHLAGYDVYERAATEPNYSRANSALVTATEYVVAGLSPGTAYDFGVVAVYNDSHNSAMGGPATCTTA